MNRVCNFLTGASLGAGFMYFLDPNVGNRRRALVRDQVNHFINQAGDAIDVTVRDFQNRMTGIMAEARACAADYSGEQPSDEVLAARVRSKLGRHVSHPSAIEVAARDGVVTLSGPILSREVPNLIRAVESVRGVQGVENQLDEHQTAGNISALQGGREAIGDSIDLLQQNWSQTTRALVGGAGAALMLRCLVRGGPMSALLCPVALALTTRALANDDLGHLLESTPSQGRGEMQATGGRSQRQGNRNREDGNAGRVRQSPRSHMAEVGGGTAEI
jgi:hypothetical protein